MGPADAAAAADSRPVFVGSSGPGSLPRRTHGPVAALRGEHVDPRHRNRIGTFGRGGQDDDFSARRKLAPVLKELAPEGTVPGSTAAPRAITPGALDECRGEHHVQAAGKRNGPCGSPPAGGPGRTARLLRGLARPALCGVAFMPGRGGAGLVSRPPAAGIAGRPWPRRCACCWPSAARGWCSRPGRAPREAVLPAAQLTWPIAATAGSGNAHRKTDAQSMGAFVNQMSTNFDGFVDMAVHGPRRFYLDRSLRIALQTPVVRVPFDVISSLLSMTPSKRPRPVAPAGHS